MNPIIMAIIHKQRSAKECMTMVETRHEIDRIDHLLVQILAERQEYINAAARIKNSLDQIRDQERIDFILKKIAEYSRKYNLSTDISLPIWKLLIEKSISHELKAWEDLNKKAKS